MPVSDREAPPRRTLQAARVTDLARLCRSTWNDESNSGQRIRRSLMVLGWQVWKRTVAKPVVVDLFNGYRFIVYPDCHVSSALLYSRIPDHRDIVFLRRHLNGGTFVDVGCHVGSVSLLIADKVEHAVMFEANPAAAARARENLAVNRLGFEVHELALSDAVGRVEFEDRGGVDTCNRVVSGALETSFPTRTVTATTFDQFLEEHGTPTPIRAVKLDVEGHENAVLKGMEHFLETGRPKLVMFEYLQRTNLAETLALFDKVGYQVIRLSRRGPLPVDERVEPLQNLFAYPHERSREFAGAQP